MSSPAAGQQDGKSKAAVLLIDVISPFDFKDGDQILREALPVAGNIARLKDQAGAAGVPVIYVNDNYGEWHSEASALIAACTKPEAKGRAFVERVRPTREDYFVLKPLHSAFYQTPLEILLKHLGVDTIVLAGLTTNSCITCTAHDANMREFKIFIPGDCCAARTREEHMQSLEHLQQMANANVDPADCLDLGRLASEGGG